MFYHCLEDMGIGNIFIKFVAKLKCSFCRHLFCKIGVDICAVFQEKVNFVWQNVLWIDCLSIKMFCNLINFAKKVNNEHVFEGTRISKKVDFCLCKV
jgi:hypothetical protein